MTEAEAEAALVRMQAERPDLEYAVRRVQEDQGALLDALTSPWYVTIVGKRES